MLAGAVGPLPLPSTSHMLSAAIWLSGFSALTAPLITTPGTLPSSHHSLIHSLTHSVTHSLIGKKRTVSHTQLILMYRCNLYITRHSETAAWLCRSENGDEKKWNNFQQQQQHFYGRRWQVWSPGLGPFCGLGAIPPSPKDQSYDWLQHPKQPSVQEKRL